MNIQPNILIWTILCFSLRRLSKRAISRLYALFLLLRANQFCFLRFTCYELQRIGDTLRFRLRHAYQRDGVLNTLTLCQLLFRRALYPCKSKNNYGYD